jgi:hypothetical protein
LKKRAKPSHDVPIAHDGWCSVLLACISAFKTRALSQNLNIQIHEFRGF